MFLNVLPFFRGEVQLRGIVTSGHGFQHFRRVSVSLAWRCRGFGFRYISYGFRSFACSRAALRCGNESARDIPVKPDLLQVMSGYRKVQILPCSQGTYRYADHPAITIQNRAAATAMRNRSCDLNVLLTL